MERETKNFLFASVAAISLALSAAAFADADNGHIPTDLQAQYADAGNGHIPANIQAQYADGDSGADGGHVPNVKPQYADATGSKLPTTLRTLCAADHGNAVPAYPHAQYA